ncbi:B12-binding domain-containing radical SAM protein [Candidatus Woesearchaeota archaeon]|nr:B12-binding domain-containing radical SAM protein [Candidatus Woesearchaeota archaeon]
MKIAIVEPECVSYNIFSYAKLPLLGPIYLGTILRNKGHNVSIINENMNAAMDKEGRLAKEIIEADILMMSGLSGTIPRAYRLLTEFKRQFPNKRTIVGGPHTSFFPEEAARYADVVVVGEAEDVIEEALVTKERFVYGRAVENLDNLPFPDFGLVKEFKVTNTPIMSSRGCPFNCRFCAVTKMFGKKYRFRSAKNVLAELRTRDTKNVFFYDDNFTANPARSKELLRKMWKEKMVKSWSSQVRVDVARDAELVRLMSNSNCERTYIGFESVNERTLELYNKGQNLKDIRKAVRTLHNNGISVHGMFVLGSDEDDRKTIQRTADFCDENEIDTTQFSILTPLPGTETYDEFDRNNRIFTKNWKFYDGLHVVFKPRLMTPLELQEGMIDSFKQFYSFSKGLRQAIKDSVEYSLASARNWFAEKKSNLPSLKSPAFKMFGSGIIRKWEQKNRIYMKELAKVTERLKQYRPEIKLPSINKSAG